MHVKRYIVDSMPDALQKIRSDLGKDAIILNTKNIKIGGWFGLFGKKKIEVIAAVDNMNASLPTSKTFRDKASGTISGTVVKEGSTLSHPPAPEQVVAKVYQGNQRPVINQDLEVLQEMKEIRSMFLKMMSGEIQNKELSHPVLQKIDQSLRRQEVDEDVILEIMRRLITRWEDPGRIDEPEALNQVRGIITDLLQHSWSEPEDSKERRIRLLHFVGPTGVGKTTTIAKLASDYVLRQKKKVGFITSDTYRIAAVDQLRTYANILNAPLEVVFSPDDMEQAVRRLQGCDVIFMDTAGRNYRNQAYVEEINQFLSKFAASETYLVLSLTAKYSDMEEVITNFSSFAIDKVIFTKKDETSTYGAILNTIYLKKLSLSYITNGQNVPEDIEIASPQTIANLIMGRNAS